MVSPKACRSSLIVSAVGAVPKQTQRKTGCWREIRLQLQLRPNLIGATKIGEADSNGGRLSKRAPKSKSELGRTARIDVLIRPVGRFARGPNDAKLVHLLSFSKRAQRVIGPICSGRRPSWTLFDDNNERTEVNDDQQRPTERPIDRSIDLAQARRLAHTFEPRRRRVGARLQPARRTIGQDETTNEAAPLSLSLSLPGRHVYLSTCCARRPTMTAPISRSRGHRLCFGRTCARHLSGAQMFCGF